MDDGSGLPGDLEQLQGVIEEAEAKIFSLQGSIAEEQAKMEGYRVRSHSQTAYVCGGGGGGGLVMEEHFSCNPLVFCLPPPPSGRERPAEA